MQKNNKCQKDFIQMNLSKQKVQYALNCSEKSRNSNSITDIVKCIIWWIYQQCTIRQ